MIQTQFLDINRYWRTGGVNVEKLKQYKLVGICAGVGMTMDGLLPEHVQLCVDNNIAYFTYLIPVPDKFGNSVEKQADNYFSMPGVRNHRTCIDIEKPYINYPDLISSSEGFRFVVRLENLTGTGVMGYSNIPTLQSLGYPSWTYDLKWWMAQYPYETGYEQFKRFDTFLAKYAGKLPSRVADADYGPNTIGWQFTRKLDAQYYLANAKTKDPVYTQGVKEGDGNVGTVEESILLSYFFSNQVPAELTDKEKLGILWREGQLHGWNLNK